MYWGKNGNKYFIFDSAELCSTKLHSTYEKKEVLKKCSEVWDEIKNKIKAINGNKKNDYGKDYMKIKFNPDDELPLSKSLTFHAMTINIRFVFNKMVNYIRKSF